MLESTWQLINNNNNHIQALEYNIDWYRLCSVVVAIENN